MANASTKASTASPFGIEVRPGFHSWEARHPEWRNDVRCAAYVTGRSVILLDPQLPKGAPRNRMLEELDRLVRKNQLPLHVVTTVHYHSRSSLELLERYGEHARWWCAAGRRDYGGAARRFQAGVRLPAGLRALPTARHDEVVIWIPRARILHAGDVLLGGKRKALRMCPPSWLPKGITSQDLAASLQPLRKLPVELLHVAHGPPIVEGVSSALTAALG